MANIETKTIEIFFPCLKEKSGDFDNFASFIHQLRETLKSKIEIKSKVTTDNLLDNTNKDCDPQDYDDNLIRTLVVIIEPHIEEEYDVALEEISTSVSPCIKVYMRDIPDDECEESWKIIRSKMRSKRQYWTTYSIMDEVRLDFLWTILRVANLIDVTPKIENGEIKIGDLSVANLNNLSFAANNEDYRKLKEHLQNIQQEIDDLERAFSVTSDEEIRELLDKKHSELFQLHNIIDTFEKDLLETAKTIASFRGKNSIERLSKAIELFESGDNKGADSILKLEDIDIDAQNNIEGYKIAAANSKSYQENGFFNIEEYRLKAKTVIIVYDNENRIKEAREAYSKAIELAIKIDMAEKDYFDLIIEYGNFLDDYAIYDEVVKTQRKCLRVFKKINKKDQDIARYCSNIRIVSDKIDEDTKEVEYYEKFVKIRERILGQKHPDTCRTYWNLAIMYINRINDKERATEYMKKAAEGGFPPAIAWLQENEI